MSFHFFLDIKASTAFIIYFKGRPAKSKNYDLLAKTFLNWEQASFCTVSLKYYILRMFHLLMLTAFSSASKQESHLRFI